MDVRELQHPSVIEATKLINEARETYNHFNRKNPTVAERLACTVLLQEAREACDAVGGVRESISRSLCKTEKSLSHQNVANIASTIDSETGVRSTPSKI